MDTKTKKKCMKSGCYMAKTIVETDIEKCLGCGEELKRSSGSRRLDEMLGQMPNDWAGWGLLK